MDKLITRLQVIPLAAYRFTFFAALAFALFMAVIPGSADPTGFVNDKVKHAVVFLVLLIKTATSATFVVMIQGSSCLYAGPKYNTPP